MNALQNLIKQVNPNAIVLQSVKKKPKFFAHFDTRTLEVVSVNNTPECDGYGAIELQEELAFKLLSGKENLSRWIVGIKDDKPELQKIDALENFYVNRVELNPIIKLDFKSTEEYDDEVEAAKKRKQALLETLEHKRQKLKALINKASSPSFMPKDYWREHGLVQQAAEFSEEHYDNMFDVVIRINRDAGTATFVYNGDIIKSQGRILRFYFTREDDPSHLKCVMRLDKETLDRVVKSNDLVMRPNPLTFKIPYGADDLSIYTIKSDLEIIVLEEK
jgi:hypothetical protein